MSARLLIAEDDAFIRAMIADFLRDSGFDVLEAESADQAVAVLESGANISLLFSDIKMPGTMDGCDLARQVRERWPDTRVLLTSGYSSALAEARNTEPQVLEKPYRPLSVLAAILSIVEA